MTSHLTLADIRDRISNDDQICSDRQRALCRSLSTFCKLAGRDPSEVSADVPVLRHEFANLHPAQTGLRPSQLLEIMSGVTRALELGGVQILRRSKLRLSPIWRALFDALPNWPIRARLSWLVRYCDWRGVGPTEVSDEISEAFKIALKEKSLVENVRQVSG